MLASDDELNGGKRGGQTGRVRSQAGDGVRLPCLSLKQEVLGLTAQVLKVGTNGKSSNHRRTTFLVARASADGRAQEGGG